MKKIIYMLSFFSLLFLFGCEKETLFDTIEAPAPTVQDTNWSANGVGFAEGGRTMRLPNPVEPSTAFRDVRFQAAINSGNARVIDSIAVELQFNPSIPSNTPLGWIFFEGFSIPQGQRSSTYNFDYTLNLDDWSDAATIGFCGAGGCQPRWIGTGSLPQFGITVNREDNNLRLKVFFDDGSWVRLAQVQFSYALNENGGG